jgi:hypothetical protein
MAIDSASKRAAVLMEGIVIPSGTIDAQERAAATWIYGGNDFPSSISASGFYPTPIILGYNPMDSGGPTIGGGI